jgi:hypothetical protein
MAELAKGRLRSKMRLLEQALTGLIRDHHRQLLTLQLAHLDSLDEQIDTLSVAMTHRLIELGASAPPVTPVETAGAAGSTANPGTPPPPMTFVRPKGTSLSALYQRLAARRGKQRAIMAVAPSIVVSAFHMLSRNEPYQELGANYFDQYRREHLVDRLTRRLERLGYGVSLATVPAA